MKIEMTGSHSYVTSRSECEKADSLVLGSVQPLDERLESE